VAGVPDVLRYCGMEPNERTAVIANAARLLQDAKLLVDHTRFASAFALAVLGVEEIGKVILDIWGSAAPLSKPVVRRSAHIRKQSAVSSLLLASFAVREFGTVVDHANEELVQRVAEAFRLSREGQLMSQVHGGAR
jgi:AbiV family abortive infection protein